MRLGSISRIYRIAFIHGTVVCCVLCVVCSCSRPCHGMDVCGRFPHQPFHSNDSSHPSPTSSPEWQVHSQHVLYGVSIVKYCHAPHSQTLSSMSKLYCCWNGDNSSQLSLISKHGTGIYMLCCKANVCSVLTCA